MTINLQITMTNKYKYSLFTTYYTSFLYTTHYHKITEIPHDHQKYVRIKDKHTSRDFTCKRPITNILILFSIIFDFSINSHNFFQSYSKILSKILAPSAHTQRGTDQKSVQQLNLNICIEFMLLENMCHQ